MDAHARMETHPAMPDTVQNHPDLSPDPPRIALGRPTIARPA